VLRKIILILFKFECVSTRLSMYKFSTWEAAVFSTGIWHARVVLVIIISPDLSPQIEKHLRQTIREAPTMSCSSNVGFQRWLLLFTLRTPLPYIALNGKLKASLISVFNTNILFHSSLCYFFAAAATFLLSKTFHLDPL